MVLSGKEKSKSCCCTCKCWCITIFVIVLVIGLVLLIGYLVIQSKFTGEATDENHAEWDAKLKKSANASMGMTTNDIQGV